MEWKIKSLSLTAIVIFLKKSWLNQGEPTSNFVLICFYNWFTSVFCAYSKLSNFHSFLLRLIVINTVFFLCARVAEALILGTMMVGQATAFAPNYNKAVLAAARVFRLLDRKPLIDSRGQSGLRLVRKSFNPLFLLKIGRVCYKTRFNQNILHLFRSIQQFECCSTVTE